MTIAVRPPARASAGETTSAGRRERLGVVGEIAARRRADLASVLADLDPATRRRQLAAAPAPRPIAVRLAMPGLHLIAEIKRSSPSAGRIAALDDDLLARARAYDRAGAAAISVLCEPHWFGGSIDDLAAARRVVRAPVLAKDFVVDPRQLELLRSAGADLVLLLGVLQPRRALARLVNQALDLGLEPLVEAHDERELEAALATRARLIGINNRDLRTLTVDPERAAGLRRFVPEDRLVIAESGVREPATVAGWRALGFDAALVGEALVRAVNPESSARAFIAAGRDTGDPAERARVPFVKICGVVDPDGVRTAIDAGADAIGLNLVPGTPRALELDEAEALARLVRASSPSGGGPAVVAITVDLSPEERSRIGAALQADAIQLSGDEPPETIAGAERATWKVLHLPPAGDEPARGRPEGNGPEPAGNGRQPAVVDLNPDAAARLAASIVGRARAFLAAGATRILLDTAGGPHPGGTGRRASPALVEAIAREIPVTLAGGLNPANVGPALRSSAAVGVDVASGVEAPRRPRERPHKDPFRVALFAKRARAARLDRPNLAARPTPVDPGLLEADDRGRWGTDREFGGRYVPETLIAALEQLERAYAELRHDPRFWAELRSSLATYAGRPTALYRADRLAGGVLAMARSLRPRPAKGRGPDAGDVPERMRLYLKREDLAHTGAHKINNALGQALLTRRLGKTRVIAETGAGQHGVATATACALLGLPCVVYMGAEDIQRQGPNVLRMRALGAEVRPVSSGSATLKDAINEAMRDWVTNVETTHYVLGSAMGPHPYPTIVRDLQRRIGDEAAAQLEAVEGRLPDLAIACVGGGSNAIGLLSRFIGEPSVRLAVSEAAGDGIETGRHAAAILGGTPGILHGARSLMLQDSDGQVIEAHSASAGLDYPGVGPQIAALARAGRLEVATATDREAVAAMRTVTRLEGILPALETAHAVAGLPKLLAGLEGSKAPFPEDSLVLLGFSGRGDKDLAALERFADVEAWATTG
jgi:tryptophan synthase beta chain